MDGTCMHGFPRQMESPALPQFMDDYQDVQLMQVSAVKHDTKNRLCLAALQCVYLSTRNHSLPVSIVIVQQHYCGNGQFLWSPYFEK